MTAVHGPVARLMCISSPATISTHGLARTFKTRTGAVEAVRGVDFHIAAGGRQGRRGADRPGAPLRNRRRRGRTPRRRPATQLDLPDLGPRTIKTLSGGQRRRLDIALGLVHQPGLLFLDLDEPSTGLDPPSRANLWDHIRALRDRATSRTFP